MRIYSTGVMLIVVVLLMFMPVPMVMSVMLMVRFVDAPCHPNRGRNNQRATEQLKIGLACQDVTVLPKIKPHQSQCPYHCSMGDGSGKPQEYGLCNGSPNSDDESGHHRFRVSGL